MIVYGDPSYLTTVGRLVDGLVTRARSTADDQQARTLLIHAGQAEQALSDEVDAQGPRLLGPLALAIRRLADAAASRLIAAAGEDVAAAVERVEQALRSSPR